MQENASLGGVQQKKNDMCIFVKTRKNRWSVDIFPFTYLCTRVEIVGG